MPNTGANGPGPAGNGSSNSFESGAIRYELFVGNRTSSFDERQSACDPGNLPLRLRRAALRIHGRCNRLRATQNIHRRVSARRRRRLLRCSGAAVIWRADSPHGTWLRIVSQIRAQSCCLIVRLYPRFTWDTRAATVVEAAVTAAAAFELYGLKSCRQPTFQRFNYFNASTDMALKSYRHFPVGLTNS